jgi:hypothetical protein
MPALSVEEQVAQTYHDNITYFQAHQPHLLERLSEFESALDNGHYQARYELEYKDEGYFDVKELETDKYFYASSSQNYAKKATKTVNFKKEESTFKTFYDYTFSKEELEAYDGHDISSSSYYAYAKIMQLSKEMQPEDAQMREIKKFIFFGTGLGTHLAEIDAKVHAETYLIVEDDLELFRLSMFVTNYQALAQKAKLFFVVFEEADNAEIIFNQFLEKSFYYNHYLKYFQMHSSDDAKMKLMHTTITGQRHLIFLFSSYFKVYLRALDYLKKEYHFLDVSGRDTSDSFAGKPVILVAAGPSLHKHLDWLEKYHDKFVVVALTASLKTLEKRGIKPDIVTHLDPFEKTCMVHIDALQSQDFIKDCLLFCGSQVPDILIEKFQKKNVFISQVNTMYKTELDYLQPICVGSFTYMVLTMLGVRELYSLGMDLALDSETGMSHTADHAYNRTLDTSTVDEIEDSIGYLKAVVKTKGNFQDEVLATLTFDKSIQAIKRFSKHYQQSYQKVYNLNDGAYLEGFQPTRLESVAVEDFSTIDKKAYQVSLLQALEQKSSSTMSVLELESMQRRDTHVKNLIKQIQKSKAPSAFNKSLYQSQLLGLTLDILDENDQEAVDLHNTYLSYLNFILPFIFDVLNTKNIQNEKRYIKKVHAFLVGYILEIAKYHEKHVEAFFEEEKVS